MIAPVLPPVAAALAWANGWLAAYLAGCARLIGGLPYASASARTALAVIGVGLVMAFVVSRLRPPRAPRLAVLLAARGAHRGRLAPAEAAPDALPPPEGLRITFLDVGQGDGALLQVPEGAVLVDRGAA